MAFVLHVRRYVPDVNDGEGDGEQSSLGGPQADDLGDRLHERVGLACWLAALVSFRPPMLTSVVGFAGYRTHAHRCLWV
jgi:hypothetical protein